MKRKFVCLIAVITLAALSTINPQLSTCHAQGTAFDCQGRLSDNGAAANGCHTMYFTLHGASHSLIMVGGNVSFALDGPHPQLYHLRRGGFEDHQLELRVELHWRRLCENSDAGHHEPGDTFTA